VAIRHAARRREHDGLTLPEDEAAVEGWTQLRPRLTFLEGCSPTPRSQSNVLDLPDPETRLFETGGLLAAPIREGAVAGQTSWTGISGARSAQAWWTPARRIRRRGHSCSGVAHGGRGNLHGNGVGRRGGRGREQAWDARNPGGRRWRLRTGEPRRQRGQPFGAGYFAGLLPHKAAYVLWMLRDHWPDDPASPLLCGGYDAAGGVLRRYRKGNGKDDGRSPGSPKLKLV